MSLEITVERVSLGKTQRGKDKTGLYANGKWYNVLDKHPELDGKTVKLKPTSINGWFDLEFVVADLPPVAQAPAAKAQSNGRPPRLNQFKAAEALSFWADKVSTIECLDPAGKASVLCSLMIATGDGRIEFQLPDEPEGDNIPF